MRVQRPKPRNPRATISVPDAADLLGIPKRTLYDYCQKNMIPHVRVMRKVLLLQKTVDAWLKQGFVTIKYKDRLDLPRSWAEEEAETDQPW